MKHGSQSKLKDKKFKLLNSSLEALIEDRKALEAQWRDMGERIIEPTTLSFPDIKGKNLLDYAIILSEKDRITDLIANGVTSDTAIALAIQYGQEDVLNWLENKGCSTKLIELYKIVSKNKFLLQKYIRGKIQVLIQSGKAKLENLWHYYACLNVEDISDELINVSGNMNKIDESKYTPLQYAILLKNIDMVKLMLSKGADPNLTDSKIDLPIYMALRAGCFDIVSILFNNGAKLVDILSKNSLFLAVKSKKIDCVNFVLSQNPDYQFCDYLGRTILHKIAMINNKKIIDLLLSKFDFKPLLELKDFQGDDALQLAINHDNTKFINCLKKGFGKKFIEKLISARIKENQVYIKQSIINKKLKYFLRLFNYDPKMIGKGSCSGLGFLKLYYTDRQKRSNFFQCLAIISRWNGSIKTAQGKISSQHLSDNYPYLKDLLTQWSNDIIWFQQKYMDPELKKINSDQHNRITQYNYLKKDTAPFFLEPFINLNQKINVNMEQLYEYVNILCCMPSIKIEFSGGKHLTSLYVHSENKFDYYDPNQEHEMPCFTDTQQLTRFIAGLKYAKLGFQTTKMPLKIYAYKNQVAQKNDDFNYFSDETLPKNQNDLIAYQRTSANNFTQLHVAVLTNSLSNVIDILKNKDLDLNSKDSHGFSALDLALKIHCIDIIKHMFQSNRFALNKEKINTLFAKAIKERDMDLISTLPISEPTLLLAFFKPFEISDYKMTEVHLLKDVDHCKEDPENFSQTALRIPLSNHDDKMAKVLIRHDLNISALANKKDPINELLIKYRDKLPANRPIFDESKKENMQLMKFTKNN